MHYGIVRQAGSASAPLALAITVAAALAMTVAAPCFAAPPTHLGASAAAPAMACVTSARETVIQPVANFSCRIHPESGIHSVPRAKVSRVSVVTGPIMYAGKPRPGNDEQCENLHKDPLVSPCYCEGGKCHCCPSVR